LARVRIPKGALILAAVTLFFLLPSAAGFYTDWLWFLEVGYGEIFTRRLSVSFAIGTAAFLVSFVVLWTNMTLALGSLTQPYVTFGATAQGQPILFSRVQVRRFATLLASLIALILALPASTQWLPFLQYRHAVAFGVQDPIFGRDVSFYVFHLPVYQFVRGTLLALVLLSLALSAGIYLLAGAAGLSGRMAHGYERIRRHLSFIVAALFVVMAAGAWLELYESLLSPATIIHGASYVDVYARLPVLRATIVVLVFAAGLAVYHAFTIARWPLFVALGAYVVIWIGGGLYAAIVQRIVVAPNEQVKELPFIEYNIAATRQAFALDRVEERELSGDAELTRKDIAANADTIENVRLWDHQPLLDTFGQIQEIRSYYDFVSVDNDRYTIDGRYRQIMLSARELNSDTLQNRSWVNERLNFTHGFGLTLGPVNQVTIEGLPVLFIKDIPPVSSVGLDIKQPSVYYGELSSDYVLVKTRAREFHHPRGDDNVYTQYAGRGGVPLNGLFRRLMFSLRFRSSDILLTDVVTPESRILYHRRIRDRIGEIAPFLTFDSDPYLVIADGRLVWLCDAYTTTDRYPYSTPARQGLNYIRNAVKVSIDAYDGTTTFYLAEPGDPIVQSLARIFPSFLRPLDRMPESLREHLRYPEDIFSAQTTMYSTYHMTNPTVFYNKEDQWEVPAIEVESKPVLMQPYYTIMKLPGEDRPEFLQMLPFTPRRKDNLAAWMVARSDREHYGRMLVFQFPKQKVVFGPRQIVARINQDQIIAPQITLWNQQGSQVLQGTLLVVPIEESLLYIRPLYLRASGGRIPELKRVIVAYQNQIVMEETLPGALNRIFGPGAARVPPPQSAGVLPVLTRTEEEPPPDPDIEPPPPGAGPTPGESAVAPQELATLAAQAQQHYDRAVEAQRAGNWALYGEELKRLGEVLARMRGQQQQPPPPPP
jgi:uncharacterized membrane protein (UPF0182 family)